jgi:hypothetical protein
MKSVVARNRLTDLGRGTVQFACPMVVVPLPVGAPNLPLKSRQ